MGAPSTGGTRLPLIAQAAIRITAREGMRGLTHRAVDREAGLPQGSTSYYARSRVRLLQVTLEQMARDEEQAIDSAAAGLALTSLSRGEVAQLFAGFVHTSIAATPERSLARLEMAMDASRRPELRAIYDRAGARFRQLVIDTLRALGSPDPQRHSRSMIAWAEGMVLDSLAGSGSAELPSYDELRTGVDELMDAMLP